MSTPPTSAAHCRDLETCAQRLEESGSYRILRRLSPRLDPGPIFPVSGHARVALYLDVETTGLDARADEIIEIAVVPFRYAPSGDIIAVHEPITQLRQPSRPIPPGVKALTGIDDDAVLGRSIDATLFAPLLAHRPLVVAHNAAFDRGFVESLLPGFASLPWACSMREVPWREEGLSGLKLSVLAADLGFFFTAHRAADDCLAAVELLRKPLPRSGQVAFAALLASARRDTYRVNAVHAPFEARTVLKGRGYRWSDGSDGGLKCWSTSVGADMLEAEKAWLRDVVYCAPVDLPTERLTAWTRYAHR